MKILFLTGNHLRHNYLSSQLSRISHNSLHIEFQRESMTPRIPKNIQLIDKKNLKKHFNDRYNTEKKIF